MEEHMENSEQNQQEKTFTQEEVNRIVQERLAREKKKTADQETTESNEGKDEHETSVDLRENRVECREFIAEKGYKKELLDILDTSNADTFRSKELSRNEDEPLDSSRNEKQEFVCGYQAYS